ncbi:hypothetical protein ACOCEA_15950 [Maribacter sp. CXY002]|uniref:hypothetical protein n=1 Tax=Maribacter luteocoastalis TaxID=3407671 RepID=UPI003B671C46
MKNKHKAIVLNFLGFALIFLVLRFGLAYFLEVGSTYISLIAALFAMVLAPKFAVAKIKGVEKLMMKWVFIKGFKEL